LNVTNFNSNHPTYIEEIVGDVTQLLRADSLDLCLPFLLAERMPKCQELPSKHVGANGTGLGPDEVVVEELLFEALDLTLPRALNLQPVKLPKDVVLDFCSTRASATSL
jgi:hypothetical protein